LSLSKEAYPLFYYVIIWKEILDITLLTHHGHYISRHNLLRLPQTISNYVIFFLKFWVSYYGDSTTFNSKKNSYINLEYWVLSFPIHHFCWILEKSFHSYQWGLGIVYYMCRIIYLHLLSHWLHLLLRYSFTLSMDEITSLLNSFIISKNNLLKINYTFNQHNFRYLFPIKYPDKLSIMIH
jgi:hypothetical protein